MIIEAGGKKIEVPDGLTQEQIGEVVDTYLKSENKEEKPVSALSALGMGASQGLTFGLADEAKSALQSFSPDVTYKDAITKNRENLTAAREQHPLAAGIGELGGMVATGVLGGGAIAARAPSALAKFAAARPVASTLGAGTVSGGLYGFGTGTGTPGERLGDAGQGAALGAVGGGVGVGVARAVGSGINALKNTVKTVPVVSSPAIAEAPEKAIGKVIKRLRKDFPDDESFQKALDEYIQTEDVGLAEIAGKQTGNLAKGSAQFPSGEAAAEKYIEGRAAGVSARIKKSVSDHLSPNTDFYGTIDDIVEQGQAKAAPLYEEAYKANKSVSSREIDRILQAPAGKKALSEARTIMMNDRKLMGLPDKELGEVARDLQSMGKMAETEGGVATGLNLRSLDYVKRSLDQQYNVAIRAGETENAKAILGLKKGLVQALDDADVTGISGPNSRKAAGGAYAQARAVSGDYLRNADALEQGREFVKLDADMLKRTFSALGDSEKDAFKAGMVRKLRDIVDKDPYKPQLYKSVFGPSGSEMRNKLSAIMTPDEVAGLEKVIRGEERLYKFRNKVLGNSATAGKQIAAEEFGDEGAQIIQTAATQGLTGVARDQVVKLIARRAAGMSDKMAGKVADILYETNPDKKLAILKQIENQSSKGDMVEQSQKAIKAYFELSDAITARRAAQIATASGGAAAAAKPDGLVVTVPLTRDGTIPE